MLNHEYFIWGAGTYGKRLTEFTSGDITFKAVIDNAPKKQGKLFCGLDVISYEEAKKILPQVKVVVSPVQPRSIIAFLKNEGFVQNEDFYSVYQFLPRYYKELDKLAPMAVCLAATTACNMNCTGCQSYINLAKNGKHFDTDKLKSDVDLFFTHIDAVMHLCFNCGESLLNAKAVAEICLYVYENYADRYHTLSLITNGSVIPSDEAMNIFSKSDVIFSVSEYAKFPQKKEELFKKCGEYNVPIFNNTTCISENWYDLGDPRIISDEKCEKIRQEGCWTTGVGLSGGLLYTCASQMWAHEVAGIGELNPGDAFDLRQPVTKETREEAYRVISTQPELGYVSHCARCNGVMTPLVQEV